ncbi:Transcriptional adapter 2 [Porphyridium purpureum]|uniref:Transcriptional adapter n=1 Tax=Porphyridium purpureum TaxID=35688 RepID=A0A5J4YS35_PORPP|nr:Transcriptional adapter 2 [Porphyridium purpureum]|eukprot:POR9335..scf229_5
MDGEDGAGATPAAATAGTAAKKQRARPKRASKAAAQPGVPQDESEGRFHCNNCSRDLSLIPRMRCAECVDYDLCLDCFSVGAVLWPHKNTHAYRIIELVTDAAFAESWGADEEERVLEGLELYGLGNWEAVCKLVGDHRSSSTTEAHYLATFLNARTAPLPDPSRIVPVAEAAALEDREEEPEAKSLRVMHMYQDDEVAGWMPRRGDFVYEWDNEAEDVVADMDITEEDNPQELELKLRVLEIYNTKLDERERRKEFVTQRGLLEYKAIMNQEKKMNKEERELKERLKPFARFQSREQNHEFMRSLAEERNLRQSIELLKEGRSAGETSVAECHKLAASMRSKREYVSEPTVTEMIQNFAKSKRPVCTLRPDEHGVVPLRSQISDKCDEKAFFAAIKHHPGVDLLSQRELELCQSIRMSPHQYCVLKEFLIREGCRVGNMKRKDAKIVRLESNKVNKVFEYLVGCGWISSSDVKITSSASPPANSAVGSGASPASHPPAPAPFLGESMELPNMDGLFSGAGME